MDTSMHTSAQFAITMRLAYPHEPGWIARISSKVAELGGVIAAIDLVEIQRGRSVRDYTIECASTEHAERILEAVKRIEDLEVREVSDKTFLMHLGGKLEIRSKVPLKTRADLSMAYTPGVARICKAIHADPRKSFNLTIRRNTIAVVSDGSAVLGLGNIGPEAAMPVMEGKAILFKEFGGVDAFPICVDTQDTDAIVDVCVKIAPSFGGINLEDITAPRCFAVEERLRETLPIPVFHDDQHGTAIVVLAGLINALKITHKDAESLKLVVLGAGAAGVACTRMLYEFGVRNIIVCDSHGAIHRGRQFLDNPQKQWLALHTNPDNRIGSVHDVITGADVFLGLSSGGKLAPEDVRRMATAPIVFAMANPVPEVSPEDVHDFVAVMATGRSDYPNQINNVLAFPGIFRGVLDVRASTINEAMKRAAAEAIAASVEPEELSPDYIIPSIFNRGVTRRVAAAVSRAAHRTHVGHRVPRGTDIYHV
jgi:malate dehydrogenase (oxaloacetate-decarboxylating)